MSFFDKRAGNNALLVNGDTVNGATADIHITTHGSDWYWAVTAVMTVATITFAGLAATKRRQHRIFHYITAGITLIAAIAYFTMASNLGFTPIPVEFQRSDHRVAGTFREIFYVRYIDWFLTTPLLLLDLLLTAGAPWPSIGWIILLDWVMIVCGLVGALVKSSYKWGYFTFGMAALFYIIYELGHVHRRRTQLLGTDVSRVYLHCGALTTFLWLLYPIAWGVCEGGNVISPDSEAVFYGILDILAKPVFGALLILGHRNIEPSRLGLLIPDYDNDTAVRGEKRTAAGVGNSHNGTGTVAGTGAGAGTGTHTGAGAHNANVAPALPENTAATNV